MRKYLFIGCGGFLGAVLRYLIRSLPAGSSGVPLATLAVNVTGAFLMALILTAACDEFLSVDPDVRLGVTTGLLGAFTTFSTLCRETVGLLRSGNLSAALAYVALSVLLGLGAAGAGAALVRRLGHRARAARANPPDEPSGESDVG